MCCSNDSIRSYERTRNMRTRELLTVVLLLHFRLLDSTSMRHGTFFFVIFFLFRIVQYTPRFACGIAPRPACDVYRPAGVRISDRKEAAAVAAGVAAGVADTLAGAGAREGAPEGAGTAVAREEATTTAVLSSPSRTSA